MSKDIKDLVKAARAQGWYVELGSRHWQFRAPDGVTIVTVSQTPSKNSRGLDNARAQLRRAGLKM